MMMGTIRGEISNAMIGRRKGICGRLKPTAAKVPIVVAISVAKTAIKILFLAEKAHS